jgi:hypothetical protein
MTSHACHAAFAALVTLGVAATSATGVALAGHDAPSTQTQAPTAVGAASAVLHALVDPNRHKTGYWFEWGTTATYGTSTNLASAGQGDQPVSVSNVVSGLQPATTYHFRVAAVNGDGITRGTDATFTTSAAAPPAATPVPTPAPPSPIPGTEVGPAPTAPPVLATSVTIARAAGTVFVRVPGATRAAALTDGASVPVGSILDTRAGTVQTALPAARTQTGTFHGGLFEVRQHRGGHGMTDLVLRGAQPTCRAGGARAAAAVTRRRPPRSLWGHDSHGRFRTRASNSVITVRGTTWFVSDRCDGTLTRVTSGSVAVRDVHTDRTVVVRAGQRHLARRVG